MPCMHKTNRSNPTEVTPPVPGAPWSAHWAQKARPSSLSQFGLSSTRAKISELQDELGQIHRDRPLDLNQVAARQQGVLGEMAQLQLRLSALDDERRGFSTERRR
jgi:hypothetical protein